ncbi:ATP-dependent DNA helicase PIF1 [Madurella mycetomatis]|uniref:ATP-dependent DNA helicase PIF1 n=1 Tax=Madurella mycetomatis TaxID=100816 RepID=A0A175VPZ7_9PEZI|nr:ATP-dependent DNA helicase PIF1 [Madurella mycetomatis]
MLQRVVEANKAAAANRPTRIPTVGDPLAKQLFPSSSPSPAPEKSTQGLAKIFKPRPQPGSNGQLRAAVTAEPLQSRSFNVTRPNHSSVNGKALASLCSKSDPFREEAEVIDLLHDTSSPPQASRTRNPPPPVFEIYESDLDDDEDLDLDFQAPTALPTLPRPQPPLPAQKDEDPPLASNRSTLSWSQSSPSHLYPPQSRAVCPPQEPVKRNTPDDDDEQPEPAVTKKPKRELPKHWARPPTAEDEDAQELPQASMVTPAPKTKAPMPWNTTASAVKAQKKQLKTQIKENSRAEASAEDIREAVKSHSTKASAIALSNEQRHVKQLVVEKGQSVFFTGPAGTGKSVLMRAIIQDLKKKYARDPERVAVTASTGLAACNIGGMTLHSFAGIGLGKEDANALIKKIRRNPKAKSRWLKTKTLIIDEVSMVDGELFDKLSQIGRIIRNNGRPWGGIQLVITGDFFQLPPVPEGGKQRESKFAFDAATWGMSIDHTIGLTEVFRQRDPEFAGMLNEMRLGKISEKTIRNFQALSRPLDFDDGLEVTELFPTRNEVETSNQRRLNALSGKPYRYEAVDAGDVKIRDKLLSNMMAPPVIELKKGAQVMLIKNMDETLVNGSLGTVIDFMSETTFEIVGAGGSSDRGLGNQEEDGCVLSATPSRMARKGITKPYPLVRFHAVDGSQRIILCVPEAWKVELPTGEVQASRKQLPLILAWALSIHKAQGQTLERVKVDLGKVFEKGQAYVALSRATTQQGLQVLRFQKDRVMAHPRVVEFYNKLYSAESAVGRKAAGSIASYVVKQAVSSDTSAGQQGNAFDDDEEEAMAAYG